MHNSYTRGAREVRTIICSLAASVVVFFSFLLRLRCLNARRCGVRSSFSAYLHTPRFLYFFFLLFSPTQQRIESPGHVYRLEQAPFLALVAHLILLSTLLQRFESSRNAACACAAGECFGMSALFLLIRAYCTPSGVCHYWFPPSADLSCHPLRRTASIGHHCPFAVQKKSYRSCIASSLSLV